MILLCWDGGETKTNKELLYQERMKIRKGVDAKISV